MEFHEYLDGKKYQILWGKKNRYLTPIWNVMIKYLFQDLIGEYEGSGEILQAECWNNRATIQIEGTKAQKSLKIKYFTFINMKII